MTKYLFVESVCSLCGENAFRVSDIFARYDNRDHRLGQAIECTVCGQTEFVLAGKAVGQQIRVEAVYLENTYHRWLPYDVWATAVDEYEKKKETGNV